jgi:hypothetical protein
MVWTAGTAAADDPAILHAAIELVPQIVEAGDQIEQGRRIPLSIAQAMKEAGIFGMAMPCGWGGPELDLLTQFRVIETLAMADGSVGWCAMIGCDSGYVSAFLDQDVARAMYPDIRVATGAAATPTGKATRVPGGIMWKVGSRSSAAASTVSGYGWAASSMRTALRTRTRMVCPKPGNASLRCRSAKSWELWPKLGDGVLNKAAYRSGWKPA